MKSRIIILFVFVGALFTLGLIRVFYLQMIPQGNLARLQKSQYMSKISLLPERGKILDRNGEELASSTLTYSLYADPAVIEHPRKIARKLWHLLGLPYGETLEKLRQENRRFIWIKRQMEPDLMKRIKELNESGLVFVEEGKRSYPNQAVASQVLGFVGIDGNGLEGLEKKYDPELKGEKISILSKRDARGRPLLVDGQIFETSNDGDTVESTLDKELQYELERQLKNVYDVQSAERAMGVVMDPNTGEILAMATYPTFDPSQAQKSNPDHRRNSVVTDLYEPGSTFKVVTAAAALRTGRIHPNTKYFCENGKMQIGKRWIHEAETKDKHKWLTLAEIIEVSSNIGSTKVAFDVGETAFRKMILDFGFGSPTGIDFQGERSGIVTGGKWSDILLSNASFGHGVGVTALQIANAYSTIANGGKLMKPFLVKRVMDHQNNLVSENEPQVLRTVLTPKEASTLTLMLSGVTQDGGTGTLARVDGYPVAGKTGTAQKVNPDGGGYLKGAYVSSFAGFVPANQPRFTIYIVVDHPRKDYYGAQVAAPVFNKIASFALRKNGFMPTFLTETKPTLRGKKSDDTEGREKDLIVKAFEKDVVPDFKGLTLREVARTLKESGSMDRMDVQIIGTGVAFNQSPLPGADLKETKKLRIFLQPTR